MIIYTGLNVSKDGVKIMKNITVTADWKHSVYSDGTKDFISNPKPSIGEMIVIKMRVYKDSPAVSVYLRYIRNGEETLLQMDKAESAGRLQYYKVKVEINQPEINYHFVILTEDSCYFYNQRGVFDYVINEDYDFRILAEFDYPDWALDCVFYQIYVDRFFNGCKNNDVKDNEYRYCGFNAKHREWHEKPGLYDEYGNLDFFGGDLKGVEDKIGYLKELGVNALYLNPIFEAPSNHKYDCSDYYNVDPHFGGNESLRSLVEVLHRESMKIILDISINHTGDTHKWFKNKPDYYYQKADGTFEYWVGVKTLPALNYQNESLRNDIYRNEDSVLKYWLKEPYNIDGWRLDVGQSVGKMNDIHIDKPLWRELRKEIKEFRPESLLLAEYWTDAAPYLQGDMWDSTMNYFGFLRPIRKYLGEYDEFIKWKVKDIKLKNKDGRVLKEEILRHRGRIPLILQSLQFNLLDSHDIFRVCHSDNIDEKNMHTSVIMLMTFPGIPCIYYGDEIGIWGENTRVEGARYPMQWEEEKWNKDLFKTYKTMIGLRKSEEVLKRGSFKILASEQGIFSFARFNEQEAIVFVNSQEQECTDIEIPIDVLGEVDGMEVLIGDKKHIEFDNNKLRFQLNSEEVILLKLIFKAY